MKTNFHRHENFNSQFITPRHVDVWCPPGYNGADPYPVIYMHDGQNLFAPSLAYGGAGCVSTHWPAGGDTLVDAMASALPDPAAHKLYFDFGTETLDAEYEPFQRNMDAHLRKAGYVENKNWLTLKFEGAEHSERSWRERVEIPLAFLLG